MRFRAEDLSFERVTDALKRRMEDLPVAYAWSLSDIAKANRAALSQLRGSCAGETIVIICNGPSINRTDMQLVRPHKSIGMNRAYLMYDTWGFQPTYFTSINYLVLNQFADDIRQLPGPKFVDFALRDILRPEDGFLYFRIPPRINDRFQADIRNPITSGGTVTYVTLQLAYFLGFSKVVIVGMDHRFSAKGVANTTRTRTENEDKDHMHPDYFPKGIAWQLPDLYRSELAYAKARDAFAKDGREIIDATVEGACTVFRKASLEEALAT
jgi:hypothetical protein